MNNNINNIKFNTIRQSLDVVPVRHHRWTCELRTMTQDDQRIFDELHRFGLQSGWLLDLSAVDCPLQTQTHGDAD